MQSVRIDMDHNTASVLAGDILPNREPKGLESLGLQLTSPAYPGFIIVSPSVAAIVAAHAQGIFPDLHATIVASLA